MRYDEKTHFRCFCGMAYRNLDALLKHNALVHGQRPTPAYTPTQGVGKRRASDPYYAARDAARSLHDPDDFDRAILAERRRYGDRA